LLGSYGLSKEQTNIVLDKKRENFYQVACLRLFEGSHKGAVTDNVGNHPNSYFSSSIAYQKSLEKNNKGKQAAQGTGEQAAKKPTPQAE
jgi:hypothetical protein